MAYCKKERLLLLCFVLVGVVFVVVLRFDKVYLHIVRFFLLFLLLLFFSVLALDLFLFVLVVI